MEHTYGGYVDREFDPAEGGARRIRVAHRTDDIVDWARSPGGSDGVIQKRLVSGRLDAAWEGTAKSGHCYDIRLWMSRIRTCLTLPQVEVAIIKCKICSSIVSSYVEGHVGFTAEHIEREPDRGDILVVRVMSHYGEVERCGSLESRHGVHRGAK